MQDSARYHSVEFKENNAADTDNLAISGVGLSLKGAMHVFIAA